MSDLPKFENSETWRNKLRNLLLRENNSQLSQPKGFNLIETNRYSLDISEDLKKLIEEKKRSKEKEMSDHITENIDNRQMQAEERFENKENDIYNKIKFEEINMEKLKNGIPVMIDDTMLGEKCIKNEISDESFEAMELMCNKTASDPNSTLFEYLNSNYKQDVVAEKKKRLSSCEPAEKDPETAALNRLLNEMRMEEQKEISEESPLKGVEMTQIEDIEAPSRLWHNDTTFQTSPVKMVGLLRPSTILEFGEVSELSSAQTSFKTALRDPLSEISSSCYETASDMSFFKQTKEVVEPDLQVSVDLIDLDKTMQITKIKTEPNENNLIDLTLDASFKDNLNDSDESVIEVLSDDDDQLEEQHSVPLIKFEDVNMSSLNVANDPSIQNDCEQDILSTSTTSNEQSLHFNDTLEEVEYMMKKGLEFMSEAGATPKQSPFKPKTLPSPQILTKKQATFTVSPAKPTSLTPRKEVSTPFRTPVAKLNSPKGSASKCMSRFELDIKPIPKLELFKKPISASKPISRPKDKFAHVISPIGTYIKKTAEVPLMSAIKPDGDEKNSSAFRTLDFESRQHKPHFGNPKTQLPKTPIPRSLPKKAYISSEYRQFVDERNAITIPGGKSLQKYLDAAVLPSVIKHDGKANLLSGSKTPINPPMKTNRLEETGLHVPRNSDTKNNSLANLSVVAGDVSLYTIKDAQKL